MQEAGTGGNNFVRSKDLKLCCRHGTHKRVGKSNNIWPSGGCRNWPA